MLHTTHTPTLPTDDKLDGEIDHDVLGDLLLEVHNIVYHHTFTYHHRTTSLTITLQQPRNKTSVPRIEFLLIT